MSEREELIRKADAIAACVDIRDKYLLQSQFAINDCIDAIAALSAQPQQEPVAWRFHFPTGRRWHYTDQSEPHERSRTELEWPPLYTAPPSGVREAEPHG